MDVRRSFRKFDLRSPGTSRGRSGRRSNARFEQSSSCGTVTIESDPGDGNGDPGDGNGDPGDGNGDPGDGNGDPGDGNGDTPPGGGFDPMMVALVVGVIAAAYVLSRR